LSQLIREVVVIDGSGHKLGRLASRVAKMLLEGKYVVIINADKVVITGSKAAILERYLKLVGRTWYSSIRKPQVWFPRRPERILWYTVARMLPRKKPKGRNALERLRVYVGVPEKYADAEAVRVEEALLVSNVNRSGKLVRSLTLEELSALLRGRAAK
jgi:large subunit ribosomal protein L13